MAATNFSGPLIIHGGLANIPYGTLVSDSSAPDTNQDSGPTLIYHGWGAIDPRYIFPKDKVQGYTGVVPAYVEFLELKSVDTIPVALGAALIATAGANAAVVSGTPMTLVAANALGITLNVPIRPLSQLPTVLLGNAVVTAAVALDFGFAFGNVTSGSIIITVANVKDFAVGMPLVIGGVGNSAGTIPLLTQVRSIGTTTITVADAPSATLATAPIGTGDVWGPSEVGFPTPQAAMPFIARGPGLFLDSRQSLSRAISITGVSGGAGGTFTIAGWDVYGEPMTDTVTVAAGASVGYTLKTFKYLKSVTPNFSDASHAYSVGTADVFGFSFLSDKWEDATVYWAGAQQTSATGWVTADKTSPATALTGDVRGTIQTGAAGAGSGIGATASNGTLSSLALTGNRLSIRAGIGLLNLTNATQADSSGLFGVQQF